MITKEEIRHLAELARIELDEKELEKMTSEADSILGYVSQIKESTGAEFKKEAGELRNVMREDVVSNEPGIYTEAILANAPDREGNYFKVKKIL